MLRGIQDAASDPDIPEVLAVICSQIGKTEGAIGNVVGYHIDHDPGPMLVIMPTLELAEAWSKDRLAPMLRDTPRLRNKVKDPRARDSGSTIRHRTFRGGHLTIAGANSPASLASRPIRFLLCDEIDRYPLSAGAEGSPLKLAETRTRAFWNAKRVYITSPGNKGACLSWEIWERSDQREYFVACHACEREQILDWKQVKWARNERGDHDPKTARYECEHCGASWSDAQRWAAVKRGRWIATKPFTGCAGFHVNALAAPWESRRLQFIVEEWLRAQGRNELLKVFINTVLAEWWDQKYVGLEKEKVEQRREVYPTREGVVQVPRGVAIVVAGVDVQDDRIEVQIQGYGRSFEQWKLQYHIIDGDPTGAGVWDDLWNLICTPLPLERGGVTYIRATAVDTGAHTLRAYDYCRPRFRVRCGDGRLSYTFAIKGRDDTPGASNEFFPKEPSRSNKGKIPLYLIRSNQAKEIIYASLEKITEPGPGYIHFPMEVSRGRAFDTRYFDQLTAEVVTDETQSNGVRVRKWVLPEGKRNEALDTAVYAEAALRGLIAMGLDLDQEALRVAPGDGSTPPSSAPPSAPPTPRREPRRSSSPWLQR